MEPKIQKIDVCIGNLDKGSDWVVEELKHEFGEIKGQKWGCLGNCGNCYRRPFVMANNRFLIEGETKEELLEKVRAGLLREE